jgi:predicted dinucleotide-binding enzyme
VILAVLFEGAVDVAREFGESLAGKIIVDITNPFSPTGVGLAIPHDTSMAQMVAEVVPASTHVVKAFNTLFRDVLASGGPRDVFMAADDAKVKASVAAFITSLGHHPHDVGALSMAHWLEGASLIEMGLAQNGLGWHVSLGVDLEGKK